MNIFGDTHAARGSVSPLSCITSSTGKLCRRARHAQPILSPHHPHHTPPSQRLQATFAAILLLASRRCRRASGDSGGAFCEARFAGRAASLCCEPSKGSASSQVSAPSSSATGARFIRTAASRSRQQVLGGGLLAPMFAPPPLPHHPLMPSPPPSPLVCGSNDGLSPLTQADGASFFSPRAASSARSAFFCRAASAAFALSFACFAAYFAQI